MEPAATEPARVAPVRAQPGTARTGLIAIVAVLTELVVIGAACNQWVINRIRRQLIEDVDRDAFGLRGLKASLTTYAWRFTPESGDHDHIWLSEMFAILTVVVVSGLLISVALHGRATFGRALLTCWMAVIAATGLGGWVRGLVQNVPGNSLRVTKAVFGPPAPGAVSFFASVVLGLAVGLVAGIVAVATRRPAVVAAAPEAAQEPQAYVPPDPPPYYGGPPAPTTRLPNVDAPWGTTSGDQQTTRFPRPPSDDDIEG